MTWVFRWECGVGWKPMIAFLILTPSLGALHFFLFPNALFLNRYFNFFLFRPIWCFVYSYLQFFVLFKLFPNACFHMLYVVLLALLLNFSLYFIVLFSLFPNACFYLCFVVLFALLQSACFCLYVEFILSPLVYRFPFSMPS